MCFLGYLKGINELAPEVLPGNLVDVVEWLHDLLKAGGGSAKSVVQTIKTFREQPVSVPQLVTGCVNR